MENNDFKFPDERKVRIYDIKDGVFIQSSVIEDGSSVDIHARIEPLSDSPQVSDSLAVYTHDAPPSAWLPELFHYLKLLTLLTNET